MIPVLVIALLGLASCSGNENTGGPLGTPQYVVTRAPDTTLSQGTAKVLATCPMAEYTGTINLNTLDGDLAVSAPGNVKPADLLVVGGAGYVTQTGDRAYFPLGSIDPMPTILAGSDPWADLDLIRGTVHILSDGGGEIDGVSTISYTINVDPAQAIADTPLPRRAAIRALLAGRTSQFQVTIWIDSAYRVRRVEVPTAFNFPKITPLTRNDGSYIVCDVDFVTFNVPMKAVAVPPTE